VAVLDDPGSAASAAGTLLHGSVELDGEPIRARHDAMISDVLFESSAKR
jgi:hypothetical protein